MPTVINDWATNTRQLHMTEGDYQNLKELLTDVVNIAHCLDDEPRETARRFLEAMSY